MKPLCNGFFFINLGKQLFIYYFIFNSMGMGKAVDALCHSDLFFNEKGGEKKINHIMK
jgi:hypothetical protein